MWPGIGNADFARVVHGRRLRSDARVAATLSEQSVPRARATFESIAATPAENPIVPLVAEQHVLAAVALHDVVLLPAEQSIASRTPEQTIATVTELARSCGKNPLVVQDSEMNWGFVANRIYFSMIREAQRVVDEGVASPEAVNQLMVDCYNWPVGPFAMVKGAGSGWQ